MRASVGSGTLGLMAMPSALVCPGDMCKPAPRIEDDARAVRFGEEPGTSESSIATIRVFIKALIGVLGLGLLVIGSGPASVAHEGGNGPYRPTVDEPKKTLRLTCANGCSMAPTYDDPNNPKTPTRFSA